MNFNIALLQISPTGSLEGNLAKGIDACRQAKKMGADLAVFPEMWCNGYELLFQGYLDKNTVSEDEIKAWHDKAIAENHNFVESFARLSKELEMAIAITFFERTDKLPKNTVIIFDRFGKKILKYSKIHTVDFKMEKFIDSGDSFNVGDLDFGRGSVRIGSMICFDRDFPEAARILMLNGAEIIVVPNACHVYDIYHAQMKIRAYENCFATLMVNYPIQAKSTNDSNGRSCAYSPVFRNLDRIEVDPALVVMGEIEEIAIAQLDLRSLRDFRKIDIRGNAYRKPKYYGELIRPRDK
ncbi:MAG: carbon-nitrogen hydrolase family protein [Firmicutes bacterium]|nr:carbon-nitrogen hydrolase family protein [Bacillota bacterium]